MKTIGDISYKPSVSILFDSGVGELFKILRSVCEHYCFIEKDGKHIDIVSEHEILGTNPNRLVMDIKNLPRVKIPINTTVEEARTVLEKEKKEYGIVVDSTGEIKGVVTKHDISYHLNQTRKAVRIAGSISIGLGEGGKNQQLRKEEKEMLQEFPELFSKLVGSSCAIQEVRRKIYMAKNSGGPILITGETGTGKQIAANLIHYMGSHKEGPFILVNCASFQESLFESEFFGYEKGAFTGATRMKLGLVGAAEMGTLFIDEIGEMNTATQAKLLHVIESGIYRRLGGIKEIKADIQLIAATNRDLKEMMEIGSFRKDLFYRLNVININIPPLRERIGDIPLLVSNFLTSDEFRKYGEKHISHDFLNALTCYRWPGNVRELKNSLLSSIFNAEKSDVLDIEHLPFEFHEAKKDIEGKKTLTRLKENEIQHIENVLKQTQGNKTQAASLLGISRSTLRRKLDNLPVD